MVDTAEKWAFPGTGPFLAPIFFTFLTEAVLFLQVLLNSQECPVLVHGRISRHTGLLFCTAACVLLEMCGCRGCAYQVMLTFVRHWGMTVRGFLLPRVSSFQWEQLHRSVARFCLYLSTRCFCGFEEKAFFNCLSPFFIPPGIVLNSKTMYMALCKVSFG